MKNTPTTLMKRADAYAALGQWDRAQADWMRAVERLPYLLENAFEKFLKAGRWREAAQFGEMRVDKDPGDSSTWLDVAPLLVLAGDEAAYRAFCGRMLQQFGGSQDFEEAEQTCKACLLMPGAIDLSQIPQETLAKSLDEGTATEGFLPWGWGVRALIAYRSGDAASAVQCVEKSQEYNPDRFAQALNLAVLALAQHQLGHLDDARNAAEQAEQIIARLPGEIGDHHDILIAQILLREAKSLFDDPTRPSPQLRRPTVPRPDP